MERYVVEMRTSGGRIACIFGPYPTREGAIAASGLESPLPRSWTRDSDLIPPGVSGTYASIVRVA